MNEASSAGSSKLLWSCLGVTSSVMAYAAEAESASAAGPESAQALGAIASDKTRVNCITMDAHEAPACHKEINQHQAGTIEQGLRRETSSQDDLSHTFEHIRWRQGIANQLHPVWQRR